MTELHELLKQLLDALGFSVEPFNLRPFDEIDRRLKDFDEHEDSDWMLTFISFKEKMINIEENLKELNEQMSNQIFLMFEREDLNDDRTT